MKRIVLFLAIISCTTISVFAQGAKNIKINEVQSSNVAGIQDEYGCHRSWIELCNSSFTTYNIRGMYLTTDKAVLNESLDAPSRQALMSLIPSGDPITVLPGKQHLMFFCNSNPSSGTRHLTVKMNAGEPTWIALYDGNGVDLIDSVTVPALAANESFARTTDGGKTWEKRAKDKVTAGIANSPSLNDKIARTKKEDPHGFAITILAMGTVFFCLALLFVFFYFLGLIMDHLNKAKKIANSMPLKPVTKTVEITHDTLEKTATVLKDGPRTKGIDKRIYIAVISMALKQYQDDVHDVESGIISITPRNTNWNNLIK